ncbi:MAG: nodulation protein NfeD [Deltaproteobacteria bacterium]|nr:nodulation protein NfeD [Deltaproteobacteria bacterium]
MGQRLASAAVACGLLVGLLSRASSARADDSVVVLTLDGTIQPASLRYLVRGLKEATERGSRLVIVELNTPGGLLVSLRRMATAITSSERPVVVHVTPFGAQAASAGFFVLISADVAVMSPGTNTGAAHPVPLGEQPEASKEMLAKVTEDAAALVRSLAQRRGRDVTWAEKAVRESLSYTAREALEKGLIDAIAADRAELLGLLDGRPVVRFDGRRETLRTRGAEVVLVKPTFADRLLMVIADPNVAYLLMVLGALGLFLELVHPGSILPGVLGGVSILLALFAFSVLPINYVGVLLITLALGLLVAEAFITSHGLLAVAGLVSFVLGSLMLVESPVPGWRIGLGLILPTALVVGGLLLLLVSRAVRARRLRAMTGLEGLVGETGEVVVALSPSGKVRVHGEYWNAVAGEPLPEGTKVRVVAVSGSELKVQLADPEAA